MRRSRLLAAVAAILLVSTARQVSAAPFDIQEAGDFLQFGTIGTLDIGDNRIRGGLGDFDTSDYVYVNLPAHMRVTAWSLSTVVGTLTLPYFLNPADMQSDLVGGMGLATGSYGGLLDVDGAGTFYVSFHPNRYAASKQTVCTSYCHEVYTGRDSGAMTYDLTLTVEAVPVVPVVAEPASLSLLGAAVLVLGRRVRRRMA